MTAAVRWEALRNADPLLRSAAAIDLAQAWLASAEDLPATPAVFERIAKHDAEHPGIADAFWSTIHYHALWEDEFSWEDAKAWILRVLHARRERRTPLSPVPGNDLEFHAHDFFDTDFEALGKLLAWGYIDVVALALDHPKALPREQAITLMQELYLEHQVEPFGTALAQTYGVLVPRAMAKLPEVAIGKTHAHRLTRNYAFNERWTVHWLFPKAPARALDLGLRRNLVEELTQAGLSLEPAPGVLQRAKIGHIPFPELPGAKRKTLYPRPDLAIDLLLRAREVLALRVVRANF